MMWIVKQSSFKYPYPKPKINEQLHNRISGVVIESRKFSLARGGRPRPIGVSRSNDIDSFWSALSDCPSPDCEFSSASIYGGLRSTVAHTSTREMHSIKPRLDNPDASSCSIAEPTAVPGHLHGPLRLNRLYSSGEHRRLPVRIRSAAMPTTSWDVRLKTEAHCIRQSQGNTPCTPGTTLRDAAILPSGTGIPGMRPIRLRRAEAGRTANSVPSMAPPGYVTIDFHDRPVPGDAP